MSDSFLYLLSAVIQSVAVVYALTVTMISYVQSRAVDQSRWKVDILGYEEEDLELHPWYDKQPSRLFYLTIVATLTILSSIFTLSLIHILPEWLVWMGVGFVSILSIMTFFGAGYMTATYFLGPARVYWEEKRKDRERRKRRKNNVE
jgi:hypothetical protein